LTSRWSKRAKSDWFVVKERRKLNGNQKKLVTRQLFDVLQLDVLELHIFISEMPLELLEITGTYDVETNGGLLHTGRSVFFSPISVFQRNT
jgi:hypothetical protein